MKVYLSGLLLEAFLGVCRGVARDRSLMLRSLCVSICQGNMLKQNIEAGLPRNQNIPPELHQVFSNYQLHNVSREDDPTTQQFKTFVEVAAATSYRFPGHADKFGRCVIINLLLGRCIFGTSAMALLIGFLHGWSACEKSIVASAVELIVRKGVVDIFITRAYSAPRILRNALMANALGNLDAVLRPSLSIKNIRPQFWRSATIHPTDAHSAAYGTLHATLQPRTRTLGGAYIVYVYHAMRRSNVFCAGQSTRKNTTVLRRGGRGNRNADFVCNANLKPAGFGHAHPVTNDGRVNNLQILLPSGHQVEMMALKHVMHVTLRSLSVCSASALPLPPQPGWNPSAKDFAIRACSVKLGKQLHSTKAHGCLT